MSAVAMAARQLLHVRVAPTHCASCGWPLTSAEREWALTRPADPAECAECGVARVRDDAAEGT